MKDKKMFKELELDFSIKEIKTDGMLVQDSKSHGH